MTALPSCADGAAFLTRYSGFLSSTGTNQEPNRLRYRFDVLFARNRSLFPGARVLDLGSHDGRWSMAALDLGAASVTGIESTQRYFDESARIFGEAGIDRGRYAFHFGDVPGDMRQFEPGQFDLILCLGLYYHTTHHYRIFEEMHRLQPKHIILDTAVSRWPFNPIVEMRRGKHYDRIVGKPNHAFIRMLADVHGWSLTEMNWRDGSVRDWSDLRSYRNKGRRSYTLTRKQ